MKYLVGYVITGDVIVEALSVAEAKNALAARLPALLKDESLMITAKELRMLEDRDEPA